MSRWVVTLSGWPWWLVLLLALVVLPVVWRWSASGGRAAIDRVLLTLLRGLLALVILLLLLEPSLVLEQVHRRPPQVLVLIDTSASMDTAGESLQAGAMLDLVAHVGGAAAAGRDRRAMDMAEKLGDLLDHLPQVEDGAVDVTGVARALAGLRAATQAWPTVAAAVVEAERSLHLDLPDPGRWRGPIERAIRDLERIQATVDAAYRNSLAQDHPLWLASEEIRSRSRIERVRRIVREVVVPGLTGHAGVEIAAVDAALTPLDLSKVVTVAGETDLAQAWAAVHHSEGRAGWDAVVMVSDGRQTVLDDPAPFVRALVARGVHCHFVQVGDERPPLDAVIAAIDAPDDVFRQELVPVQIRYRVPPAPSGHFELVVSLDEEERHRRRAAPSADWRYATVMLAMPRSGTVTVTARLQAIDGLPQPVPERGLLLERWFDPAEGDDLRLPARSPEERRWVEAAQIGEAPGAAVFDRLRCVFTPPEDGVYRMRLGARPAGRISLFHQGRWEVLDEILGERTRAPLELHLHAGQGYPLEILHRYRQASDGSVLQWRRGQGDWQLFDAGVASPPVAEPPPDIRSDNNSAARTLVVHDEPLRVLLVDRQPRWDARLLAALGRDGGAVAVDTRYLTVQQMRGDPRPLPDRQADLAIHDAVIIGDLHPQDLQPAQQEALADYVADGGILLLVAGRQSMPASFNLGRLADLLPITNEGRRRITAPTRVRLGANDEHPITRILPDASRNRRLWEALPPIPVLAAAVGLKAGAEVLLETIEGVPVIVTQRYGLGRVVFIGSDETWRWRAGIAGRLQQHLWLRLLRWGTGVPMRGQDARLQVAVERSLLQPGEMGVVRIRIDRALGDVRPRVDAAMLSDDRSLPVTLDREGMGGWRAQVAVAEEGRCRILVRLPSPEGTLLREERQLVVRRPAGRERIDIAADRPGLARLAGMAGAPVRRLGRIDRVVDDLRHSLRADEEVVARTWTLWDTQVVPWLLLGLLAVEWSWRRLRGMA